MNQILRTITTLFRWWREAVLTIGALAGLTCILLAIGAVAFDSKALVFQSGSMEPAVSAGALGFTRPADADALEIGDVVSVVHDGTRITHRIANIEPNGPGTLLTLQGDANDEPDSNIYEVSSTDRLVFDVPYLGYAVAWAATPQGLAVIGLLSGGLLYMVFRNAPRIGGRHLATGCVAVSMMAGLLAGTATDSTLAYFTDTGAVTTGPFAAHTVGQPPGPMNCTGSSSMSMTVTVPHGDDRHTYVAKVFNNAGTTQLGTDLPMARSGSTWTRTITRQDANSLSLLTTYRIRVYAHLTNAPAWQSQSYREWTFRTTGLSILLVLFTCDQRTA